jgi:DNA segregation ATPase FtsK/SpoIIIE-like protein
MLGCIRLRLGRAGVFRLARCFEFCVAAMLLRLKLLSQLRERSIDIYHSRHAPAKQQV